jgi:hypothetical protein
MPQHLKLVAQRKTNRKSQRPKLVLQRYGSGPLPPQGAFLAALHHSKNCHVDLACRLLLIWRGGHKHLHQTTPDVLEVLGWVSIPLGLEE